MGNVAFHPTAAPDPLQDEHLLDPSGWAEETPQALGNQVDAFVLMCRSHSVTVASQTHLEDVVVACVHHDRTDLIDRILDALPSQDQEIVARFATRQTVATGQASLLTWLMARRESLGFPMLAWERMATIHSAVRYHHRDPKVTSIIQAVGSGKPLDEACEMFNRSDDPQDLLDLVVAAPPSAHERLLAQWVRVAEPARALIRHRQSQDPSALAADGQRRRQRP